MADEGLQHPNITKDGDGYTNSRSLLVKAAEVILDIIAIGLIVEPLDSFQQIFNKPRVKVSDIAIIYVTLAGFVIINGLLILSHFLGDRMPKKSSLLFTATGTILHVLAGFIMVNNWRKLGGDYTYTYNNAIYPSKLYMDMLLSSSIIVFFNAIVFGGDLFLTIKYF